MTDENNSEFENMLANALNKGDDASSLPEIDPILDSDALDEPLPEGHKSGFVAVVGRPNVGKSTLVNAIIGEKIAIVSAKPQTTRVRQLGIYTRDDVQIVFVDTPGIHQAKNNLGHFMVDVAVQALRDADVVLFVTDASEPLTQQDQNVANIVSRAGEDVQVIRVLNKVDQHHRPEFYQSDVQKHLDLVPHAAWTTTVASSGKGIDTLMSMIIERLPEGPRYFPPDQVSDLHLRDMAAEYIRESVLHLTHDEVPHSVATLVEQFKERDNGMIYIEAHIYVERDNQKKIIIGKNGELIKRISTRARKEIEEMLGKRVYLDLYVKVMPNWRRDEKMLQRLGYRISQY